MPLNFFELHPFYELYGRICNLTKQGDGGISSKGMKGSDDQLDDCGHDYQARRELSRDMYKCYPLDGTKWQATKHNLREIC